MSCKTRLELKYLAGEPTHPWVGMRYRNGERGGEIVTEMWADMMDAVNEMCAVRLPGETMKFPDYLKDQILLAWYLEGVEIYKAGLSRDMCRLSFVLRGFDDAWQSDVQPVALRRHAALTGVHA